MHDVLIEPGNDEALADAVDELSDESLDRAEGGRVCHCLGVCRKGSGEPNR